MNTAAQKVFFVVYRFVVKSATYAVSPSEPIPLVVPLLGEVKSPQESWTDCIPSVSYELLFPLDGVRER